IDMRRGTQDGDQMKRALETPANVEEEPAMAPSHVLHRHAVKRRQIEDECIEQRQGLGYGKAARPDPRVQLQTIEDAPRIGGEPVADDECIGTKSVKDFPNTSKPIGLVDQ